MFNTRKKIKSMEFELVQLRLHLAYQNDLWEKVAKKLGVRFPKIDIYKQKMDELHRAVTEYEKDLITNLLSEKEQPPN